MEAKHDQSQEEVFEEINVMSMEDPDEFCGKPKSSGSSDEEK